MRKKDVTPERWQRELEKSARWHDKNRERMNLRRREARQAMSKADRMAAWLWEKYKIGFDDYLSIFAAQAGVCAICSRTSHRAASYRGTREALCVDHDHETGKIRGLLCRSCNTGVGLLQDSPENCRRAALYLESHKTMGLE